MFNPKTKRTGFVMVIALLACQLASIRPTAGSVEQQGGMRGRANATSDPADWRGWARCQIDVQGNGYADQQIHTWTMTGGAPTIEGAFRVYQGTWSVVGEGWSKNTQSTQTRMMAWASNVEPISAPIAVFVRASDGRLVINARHAQLRSAGSIAGYDEVISREGSQPAIAISGDVFEFSFPVVEGSPGSETISGSSTPNPNGRIGYLQQAGTRSTASCVWQFGQGAAAPAPPPVLEARAIPTPGTPPSTASAPGLPPGTAAGTPTRRDPTDLPPRRVPSTKAFTASGSFTVPKGVTSFVVELWGAGGGGGLGKPNPCPIGSCSGGPGGHGGGGGAYTTLVVSVSNNAVFDVVVGKGGLDEIYNDDATDGSASLLKQGNTVLVVAEGGKAGGAGGVKSHTSGAEARAGGDGPPGGSSPARQFNTGPIGTGTIQPGGKGGEGGSSPNAPSSPAVARGGSGGTGAGWSCDVPYNCKELRISGAARGLDGYVLITW